MVGWAGRLPPGVHFIVIQITSVARRWWWSRYAFNIVFTSPSTHHPSTSTVRREKGQGQAKRGLGGKGEVIRSLMGLGDTFGTLLLSPPFPPFLLLCSRRRCSVSYSMPVPSVPTLLLRSCWPDWRTARVCIIIMYIWTTYVAEYYLLLIIVRSSDSHGEWWRVVHIRNGGKRNNRVSITFGQWLDGWSEWVSPHWY